MSSPLSSSPPSSSPLDALRIGSRASPLAMAQAQAVADALVAGGGFAAERISLVPMTTQGDARLDVALADIGGKGLFTAELEAALRSGTIDCAVHSLKDLPTRMDDDMGIIAVPERADARDALIVPDGMGLDAPQENDKDILAALPKHARIGTASLRRQAQLLRLRPDLRCELLRGNLATRLAKIDATSSSSSAGDALFGVLAVCGLERQALAHRIFASLPEELVLPAAGQGALGIQALRARTEVAAALAPLEHTPTRQTTSAERAFLAGLDGSCRLPIAARARLDDKGVALIGRLLSMDGTTLAEARARAPASDPEAAGRDAAAAIRRSHGALLRSLLAAQ